MRRPLVLPKAGAGGGEGFVAAYVVPLVGLCRGVGADVEVGDVVDVEWGY